MSDEEKADVEGGGEKKKKSKLVLILIAVNVLTLGGFGAFVMLGGDAQAEAAEETAKKNDAKAGGEKKTEKSADTDEKEEAADKEEKAEGGGAESGAAEGGDVGPTALVGKFTINLADQTTSRYLRVVINAQVDSEETAVEIKVRNAQLRHIAIAYLSSLKRKDTQGPGSLDQIRSSLERRFNHVLTEGAVKQVYFTDFVTQ